MHSFLGTRGFGSRFGNVFQEVFCGREARRSSFRSGGWQFLLTTNRFLHTPREFQQLCTAVRSVGDDEFAITNITEYLASNNTVFPYHQWACVISSDYESYVAAMESEESGMLMGGINAWLGSSGRWGAIIDRARADALNYTMLGGDAEFIQTFAASRGGVTQMREDFLKYLREPGFNGWPQIPSETTAALLADLGW